MATAPRISCGWDRRRDVPARESTCHGTAAAATGCKAPQKRLAAYAKSSRGQHGRRRQLLPTNISCSCLLCAWADCMHNERVSFSPHPESYPDRQAIAPRDRSRDQKPSRSRRPAEPERGESKRYPRRWVPCRCLPVQEVSAGRMLVPIAHLV